MELRRRVMLRHEVLTLVSRIVIVVVIMRLRALRLGLSLRLMMSWITPTCVVVEIDRSASAVVTSI